MTGLTLQVNDREVMDVLGELARRAQNLRPALEDIGNALEKQVILRFDTKVDPLGQAWAAWAPSTAKARAKEDKGMLLEYERWMIGSLSYQADDDSVEVGFGKPYAVYHEFGTEHIPRRGMLTADPEAGTLAPDDQQTVLDILHGYLAEALD